MNAVNLMRSWFGWWGGYRGALTESRGVQNPVPSAALIDGVSNIGADGALQISTVWSACDRRATTVASLPFFAYRRSETSDKVVAYTSTLYSLLHDSPNSRMTPFEFWRAMMLNHDLRGNAYARLVRSPVNDEVLAMWPMPTDQTESAVLDDGTMIYKYQIGDDTAILHEHNVLHLKNLGNGTVGLSKLEYMRATTTEAASAQLAANRLFANGGKPTGILMVDAILKPEQRAKVQENFIGMASGSISSLHVLEANMKYQQLSLSPQDQQLLETRKFGVEEMCRWFDVPPVLLHHSNVTTWGSGIEQIVDGWHKLSLRPILVSIEQAVRKRVMTAQQRARMSVEYSLDALLRGNIKDRMEVYSTATINGIMTRAECRQLENLPVIAGSDVLTAPMNLAPLDKLGTMPASGGGDKPAIGLDPGEQRPLAN